MHLFCGTIPMLGTVISDKRKKRYGHTYTFDITGKRDPLTIHYPTIIPLLNSL